jgi:hypothetical protein
MCNRKRPAWKLILCCFEPCVLLNFKAPVAKTWTYHGLKIIFLESTVHRLSVDVLFVHHETSVEAAFSICVIEKDVKVNIMLQFELYVLSNFKALVAETWIWASLKIVFLECTVHKLSVDALFVCQARPYVEIKSSFFQLCNRKRYES